jgi:hypothetical protein
MRLGTAPTHAPDLSSPHSPWAAITAEVCWKELEGAWDDAFRETPDFWVHVFGTGFVGFKGLGLGFEAETRTKY